jgi:hypothetical protein
LEGKTINNGVSSKVVKQLEKDKEYQYSPLPNIQAARLAYLQAKGEEL